MGSVRGRAAAARSGPWPGPPERKDPAVLEGRGVLVCGLDSARRLDRKRTGEHFLHGEGGAASRYASYSDDGWSGWGETIRPMSYDAARDWAERNMDADAYEAAFGPVPEDAGNVPVTLSIPASAKARLEALAARTGETQSAIVARLIETL